MNATHDMILFFDPVAYRAYSHLGLWQPKPLGCSFEPAQTRSKGHSYCLAAKATKRMRGFRSHRALWSARHD